MSFNLRHRPVIGPILVFLCLFLLRVGSVAATDKIVLLTSLDPDENRPPLHFKSWDINEKLEKRFYKYLKGMDVKLKPEVVHFSTAENLYTKLQDRDVKALIWVGHAGFYEGAGIAQNKTIIDYKGRDLKNLFQLVGPHLRYLGLVGCRGEFFLKEWQEKGWFTEAPHLITFGREVRTDARKGLRLAMKELKELYKKNPNLMKFPILKQHDNGKNKIHIYRTNHSSEKMDSIQIMQREKLVGFLPGSLENQEISLSIELSDHAVENKIISDSGYSALGKENPNLGRLEIQSDQGQWELFQTRTGQPIGVGKHIYRYKTIPRR